MNLREEQRLAADKCVPYLGVYFKDLVMVDERFQLEKKKTKNNKSSVELVNFNKIVLLSSIVKRVTVCANSDAIKNNQDLVTF